MPAFRFDPGSSAHIGKAFGEQRDKTPVERVHASANLGHRMAIGGEERFRHAASLSKGSDAVEG